MNTQTKLVLCYLFYYINSISIACEYCAPFNKHKKYSSGSKVVNSLTMGRIILWAILSKKQLFSILILVWLCTIGNDWTMKLPSWNNLARFSF